ncbi:MAG TPA: glycosyltransferase [Polyangia bacterium]|jgi:biofilm PGA synthesis N-glycosyltransferase PgaC|nr:glycosyltransferase [Polyangia bacterium]
MVGAALICLGLLAYTYVGYPLLIGALARLRPRAARRHPDWEPTVTACVAAYNVARTIDAKLESLVGLEYPAAKLEIIVYSDGSTDGTDEIVGRWAAADRRIRLIRGEQRLGKPTGLNCMRAAARGQVLLITDARQPLAPRALRALLDLLGDLGVGCVTGNLVLEGGAGSGVYWRYENWIRRQEARFRSVVGMTGPIAAIRRTDLDLLPSDLILDDIWIPMRLRLRGRRVLFSEEAVAYDRAFDDAREFGRKVRTLAGNYQIFARMPALLSPFRNPSWFETVSHKVMRLLCPWALVALFVVSAVELTASGGAMGWRVLMSGQLGFYGAALLGSRAGRLAGVARTFLVMHVAAVVGLWRFATGGQKVTW